jgi:uncharacterized protein (TIGR00251 family)
MIPIQHKGEHLIFRVRVHPRAQRDGISGALGDSLKLDLTAPPVEGKANQACIRFFAELLKLPRSSITIAAGANSRNKLIRISGSTVADVETALADAFAKR